MLFRVRNFRIFIAFALLVSVGVFSTLIRSSLASERDSNAGQNASLAQQNPQPTSPVAPQPSGFVVVLDPAHGGTDSGARGESGVVEKDLVLQFARVVKTDVERQDIA